MLPAPAERADEDVAVELDRPGERVERRQPRLLAPLAAGRRPQRGVAGLEVTTELEPRVGLAVVGEQDAPAGPVEDDARPREVGRRARLRDGVRVGGEVLEVVLPEAVLRRVGRRPPGEDVDGVGVEVGEGGGDAVGHAGSSPLSRRSSSASIASPSGAALRST